MLNDTDIRGLDNFLARQSSDDAAPLVSDGTLIGEWKVVGFLGCGGTSEVYRVVRTDKQGMRATARGGDIPVAADKPPVASAALKLLTRPDESARRRFAAEVSLMAGRNVPAAPHCYAAGDHDGHPYVVIELLEPLEVPSSEKGIAAYLLAVCDAVAALHLAGYVHRDLKPKNIMRRPGATRLRASVVLIDFGLAKDTAQSSCPRSGVSIVGGKPVGVGTPDYAAPEQWLGGEASPASDIHALGRIANNAFNGKPPRNWSAIIRCATSSIPEQRYKSVEEFAAAIRRRNFWRHIAICLGVALLGWSAAAVFFGGNDFAVALRERRAWKALCEQAITTNLVHQELVKVVFADMNGMKVPAERHYRMETNQAVVVRIKLADDTNVFSRPVMLAGGREYWVTGPGVLDGTFRAVGTNVTMRLKNCIVRNHAAEPMGRVGINYDLQDGAGLDLPELDEPDDHGRHHIERSGSPTRLTFKGTGL